MPEFPSDLHYTPEHEWVRDGDDAVRVGITAYAQEALGDIVFISLPAVGTDVSAGDALGEVESTKSVNDVYAPVSGTVTAVNSSLDDQPDLVNSDPYGEGWLIEIRPADASATAALLDAEG
ncbi:MAG TPA: glycine cleavage system protein GcvH, partial [Actinomycetes bacterium]|nr:glycine cleavage system protein GcvH [Actinomycetes bacterium]